MSDGVKASQERPKKPRDLADKMKLRRSADIVRKTLRVPRVQAQRRAKDFFEEFPSADYLTEIERWREVGKDEVERRTGMSTGKRLFDIKLSRICKTRILEKKSFGEFTLPGAPYGRENCPLAHP
jgi:hypothetical protein